jgi:hypothetical protein
VYFFSLQRVRESLELLAKRHNRGGDCRRDGWALRRHGGRGGAVMEATPAVQMRKHGSAIGGRARARRSTGEGAAQERAAGLETFDGAAAAWVFWLGTGSFFSIIFLLFSFLFFFVSPVFFSSASGTARASLQERERVKEAVGKRGTGWAQQGSAAVKAKHGVSVLVRNWQRVPWVKRDNREAGLKDLDQRTVRHGGEAD